MATPADGRKVTACAFASLVYGHKSFPEVRLLHQKAAQGKGWHNLFSILLTPFSAFGPCSNYYVAMLLCFFNSFRRFSEYWGL